MEISRESGIKQAHKVTCEEKLFQDEYLNLNMIQPSEHFIFYLSILHGVSFN